MRLPLIPHPTTADVGGLTLEVEVRRAGRGLSLEYVLGGPVETVRWPEGAARVHTDGLWRSTCFEAFVAAPLPLEGEGVGGWGGGRTDGAVHDTPTQPSPLEGEGYLEINLSPSGAWAAYGFDGYRRGMRELNVPAPFIVMRQAPGRAVLTADVELPEGAAGPIGLCAVIERWDGAISYWALAHPSDKPDFHHPESLVLELP